MPNWLIMNWMRKLISTLFSNGLLVFTVLAISACHAAYRYDKPTPLPSTPQHHPAQRVVLISIDGMHAVDLQLWVKSHPHSTLALLASRGIIYTNANVPLADMASGMAAMATGGTTISTGIISRKSWDRTLSPPGSHCRISGTAVSLSRSIDRASSVGDSTDSIDSAKLPLDPSRGCTPLYPHNFLRVNTVFELVHQSGGRTAWTDKYPSIADLNNGPSGRGIDDIYIPKTPAMGTTDALDISMAGDNSRVFAMRNEINGMDHRGKSRVGVPMLFGMAFTSVSTAQSMQGGGYLDASGTPGTRLEQALEYTDESIGNLVRGLKARHLYSSTFFFITSRFGQSPMDPLQRRVIDAHLLKQAVENAQPGLVTHISSEGGMAMIWLKEPSQTTTVVNALRAHYQKLGIEKIYSGEGLQLRYNDLTTDPRMPNILLQASMGVIWTSPASAELNAPGGLTDEGVNVPVLVSGPGLEGRIDKTEVPTSQIAPAILKSLGMEKFGLEALHHEHTPAIPDIF